MKTFNEINELFSFCLNNDSRKKFKEKFKRDYAFYSGYGKWNYGEFARESGVGQWSSLDLTTLSKRGQEPITHNLIHPQIKALEGLETNTRSYIAFKPSFYSEEAQKLCDLLTGLGRSIQESEDFGRQKTLAFRDCLVCGIGWLEMLVKPGLFQENDFSFKRINPLDVLYDYRAQENDLSDIKFLFKRNFIDKSEFEAKFYKIKTNNIGSEQNLYDDNFFDINNENVLNNKIITFTFYEKEFKKFYICKVEDPFGNINDFYTFSKKEAEKVSKTKDIREFEGEQIFKYELFNGKILKKEPYEPIDPRIKDFTIVPAVFEREQFYPFLPDGIVSKMKSSQMQINRTITKATHEASANRVVVTAPNITDSSLKSIRDNLEVDPTLLIIPSPNVNIQSIPNIDISNSHLKLNEFATKSIKEQTNIHNEFLGQQTYAGQSGVLVSKLQSASLRSLVGFFTPLFLMQLRLMRVFLVFLQNQKDIHVIYEKKGQDSEQLRLNDDFGDGMIENNISGLKAGVFVDFSGSDESLPGEMRERVERLLSMPNSMQILTNEHICYLLGIPNADEISKTFKTIQYEQMMREQQIKQAQMQNVQQQQLQ